MRLQVAALATALAVTWGLPSDGSIRLKPDPTHRGPTYLGLIHSELIHPRPVRYETGSSVSSQDASGEGIRLFLVRLQRVVQQGNLAAYSALLDESADS